MGRPLSVFWLCLLAVSVGCVCYLCLLAALVGAVPFYRLAVPVGCACWPCLLSVPLVRSRGGGTFLSFGRACCLCLLAVSVGRVCCLCLLSALVAAAPRLPPARRYPGFHQRGGTPASTSAAIPRVAHRGAARADPPSGAANATTARPHSNAPRGQIPRFCRS